jgi:hypothetical protein
MRIRIDREVFGRSIQTSLAAVATIGVCLATPSVGSTREDAPRDSGGTSASSNAEIARQLANPISNLYSLQLQNNLTLGRGNGRSYRGRWTTNFQPALPLHLNEDWNLIVRPVFNFTSTPVLDDPEFGTTSATGIDLDRTSGIGQTSLLTLLSPRKSKLLWGVGPTFIIPTTTRDELSQRKYSVGPAAVFLKSGPQWTYGIFPQYWWSISGSGKRREVSQANIQYFVWRAFGDGWQVGMAPNITYNRKASGGDAWQVPIGIGIQKVVRLGKAPVRLTGEVHYYVKHSDGFGPRWNFRFAVTPVIPALIQRDLF